MTEVEDEVEETSVAVAEQEQEEAFDLEDNRQPETELEVAVEAEAVPATATAEVAPAADARTLWQQSTIQISIHLLPVDGQPGGRPVMLGLRAGEGAPVIHQLREVDLGRLPFFVADQLARLEANEGKPAQVESQTTQAPAAKAKAAKGKATDDTAKTQGAAPAQMDLFDW